MAAQELPLFLQNNISLLNLPVYIKLGGGECHPPARLALGDSLMVLGIIRNYGKPLKLFFEPDKGLMPLFANHPLVKELRAPSEGCGFSLNQVALARSGRQQTWQADILHPCRLPPLPVDKIRGNPILAHSLYYRLPRREDWPSIMLHENNYPLDILLSRQKPNLVLFPINPGRRDAFWQDESWWLELMGRLKPKFCLLAVGASQYGAIGRLADAVVPMTAPESTIVNLASLMNKAHGVIGRDGGLSHLAAGVNNNIVTIWDSMGSYRYWAGSRGHHIIFSNPEMFRYPVLLNPDSLRLNFPVIKYRDGQGNFVELTMPEGRDLYEQKAVDVFGSMGNLASLVMGQLELAHDRAGVKMWMDDQKLKAGFYQQSLNFAQKAVSGSLGTGKNWVVPFSSPWESGGAVISSSTCKGA